MLRPGLLLGSLLLVAVPIASAQTTWQAPEGPALARHEQALAVRDAQYDPAEQMIRRPFSTPGYHTELQGGFVHPTRESLLYALALLDSGQPEREARAVEILRRVVALQDVDPTSRTYGIWSWYLEEPLAKMAQPDFNWADFNGATLLQVSRDHRDRLPPDLARAVDAAILHACARIKKRNVAPGYTNIAAMGAYVTLIAGEHLGVPEYADYGKARLARLHAHWRDNGGFEEYNSPTYTLVTLQELSRLHAQVRDSEAKAMSAVLVRAGWEELVHHFHAPTRQWAGPHSRAYHSLLPGRTLDVLERAAGGAVDLGRDTPEIDDVRQHLRCPPDLIPYLGSLATPRTVRSRFIARSDTIGTTYLHPDFALGSINYGDLWNQRRALLVHFGNAASPGYLQLRFLKNGYDFASAFLHSAQEEGRLVGAVTIVTDGGDTHISLKKVQNATIQASDLRMRFELGGPAAQTVMLTPSEHAGGTRVSGRLGAVALELQIAAARFDGRPATVEIGGDATRRWCDVVLYAGPERTIDLRAVQDALVAFGLALGSTPEITLTETAGEAVVRGLGHSLTVPVRPGPRQRDDSVHAPVRRTP